MTNPQDSARYGMNTPNTQLKRKFGLWSVTIVSLSATLMGLFVLPAFAFQMMGENNGPTMWIAFVLSAFLVLPAALSKSELSTAMPTSGGSYVFIARTFGPLVGTITGLGLWVSFVLKSSFALIGFSAYFLVLTNIMGVQINLKIISLSVLALLVGINILGAGKIKAVQGPIVTISVAILIILSVWALSLPSTDLSAAFTLDYSMGGTWALAETTAFVFVAYAGVTKIAAIAEEVKDPDKNLPRGILLSLAISTLLYGGVMLIMGAVLPPDLFIDANQHPIEDPIYQFAHFVGGYEFGLVTATIAVLAMIAMALAGVLASSRFLFAMARDNLLPSAMENVHPIYETPRNAVLLTGIGMALAIIFLPVHEIAKLASGFKIMIFMLINICVVVLRTSKVTNVWYHPTFKSPLYPAVQIFGIFSGAVLLFVMGITAVVGASFAIIVGTALYYFYGRTRSHSKRSPWNVLWARMSKDSEADTILWRSVFRACDIGRKGHLNLKEFQTAMHVLEPSIIDDDLRSFWHNIDTNEDGIVDIEQFLEALHSHAEPPTLKTVKGPTLKLDL
jgi:APA family basic amino acid/polyamine antiporter